MTGCELAKARRDENILADDNNNNTLDIVPKPDAQGPAHNNNNNNREHGVCTICQKESAECPIAGNAARRWVKQYLTVQYWNSVFSNLETLKVSKCRWACILCYFQFTWFDRKCSRMHANYHFDDLIVFENNLKRFPYRF